MANNNIRRAPSRKLLQRIFGDNMDLIRQYENLFSFSDSIQDEIDNIEKSVGLDEDGNYIQPDDTRFLDNTLSVMEALFVLDEEIGSQEILNISNATGDISLLPINQLVIVDATSTETIIILPNPTDTFRNDNSKTITITKKDTTSNKVIIKPFGTELVVGEPTQELELDGELLTFITDGVDWQLGG